MGVNNPKRMSVLVQSVSLSTPVLEAGGLMIGQASVKRLSWGLDPSGGGRRQEGRKKIGNLVGRGTLWPRVLGDNLSKKWDQIV